MDSIQVFRYACILILIAFIAIGVKIVLNSIKEKKRSCSYSPPLVAFSAQQNCIHDCGCGCLKPTGRASRSSVIRLHAGIRLHANQSKEVETIYIGSVREF